jgi:Uma2 family endonuclease
MATVESNTMQPAAATATVQAAVAAPIGRMPELQAGDHLTRIEFERRYAAMPEVKKAELIEGVVYMPSPVSHTSHSRPHGMLTTWLGTYCCATPGTDLGSTPTVRLDLENEPQPDSLLRILPEYGGQSRDEGEYIGGAPELIAEVSASSASYDLHEKLRAYQRNGVREYLVWRVWDSAIDWFIHREGRFERLPLTESGHFHSEEFPGLWLDPAALIRGDFPQVMAVLQQGLASPEHAAFMARLQAAAK